MKNKTADIFIRETCNGFWKIIIRRKGWYWFKCEESFSSIGEAVACAKTFIEDMSDFSNEDLRPIPTQDILPEPNANAVYRVIQEKAATTMIINASSTELDEKIGDAIEKLDRRGGLVKNERPPQ